LKRFTVLALILVTVARPCCVADDSGATLRTQGNVTVNGNPALTFSTIFPNTLIETEKGASALIEFTGSRVEIGPETIVEFEGNEVTLEHGSLSVLTFRSMTVKVSCILATPVHSNETLFTVTDLSGRFTVSAIRNDVEIKTSSKTSKSAADSTRAEEVTVHQGEQKSRDEKCGESHYETHAAPAGTAGWFSSPYAKIAAAGAVGGILCWIFCRSNNPASPSIP
jgi:hypothetical protein